MDRTLYQSPDRTAADDRSDGESGLRVTEMCRLRWRDVDVHHERLVIGEAKTDVGNHDVDLSLDRMEELMAWRAERQPASPDEHVFPTASG
jgi:integrase